MVYKIQSKWGNFIGYSKKKGIIREGMYVLFRHKTGVGIGKITQILPYELKKEEGENLVELIRIASEKDKTLHSKIISQERYILSYCLKKIKSLNLPIKIANINLQLDSSTVKIEFLTSKKVDLKPLVKELVSKFKRRFEFQPIGVRTYAKQFNAIGICGRPLCCATFLKEFISITVEDIRTQKLSCGPPKLTGFCGKLMCCLAFERYLYQKK
jgi:cell fate regulator YaaT (PSP1 superfamily)